MKPQTPIYCFSSVRPASGRRPTTVRPARWRQAGRRSPRVWRDVKMTILGKIFKNLCEHPGVAWNGSGCKSVHFERDLSMFRAISDAICVEFTKKTRYELISMWPFRRQKRISEPSK